MAMSGPGIQARMESEMQTVMGVTDTSKFQTFTAPIGTSLYTLFLQILVYAPPPIPPSTVTPGGPCTIVSLPALALVKSTIDSSMRSQINPSDPDSFEDFLDGISPGVVKSYSPPGFSVTCPPGGGVGTVTADKTSISSQIESDMQSLKDIQDVSQLQKFSIPFAEAVYRTLTTDMQISFFPIGGPGIVS